MRGLRPDPRWPFVLLDRHVTGGVLLFQKPLRLLSTREPREVGNVLAQMEEARRHGFHLAGYVAYEAGYAFEARLAPVARHPTGPLLYLGRSAGDLGFQFDRNVVERRLVGAAVDFEGAPMRVRMVLSRSGGVEVTWTSLDGTPTALVRVAVAGPRHLALNPWLRHKTTMRERYERPLAAKIAAVSADEVLFLNEDDDVCEGARSNVFVKQGHVLLTPPLACGALPGTLRAHLIAVGKAREARLRLIDLADVATWFMGNSVRGLVPATLIVG